MRLLILLVVIYAMILGLTADVCVTLQMVASRIKHKPVWSFLMQKRFWMSVAFLIWVAGLMLLEIALKP